MNTHKILLGALLIKPNLAPYALPDLEIEYFPADLQPVFAALSGFWNATGKLDAVDAAHSGTGSLDPVPESGPAGWQRSNHLCRLAGTLQPDG